MGLPCGHTLRRLAATDQSVQLTDIHRHWHVDRVLVGVDAIEYRPTLDPVLDLELEALQLHLAGF
jgi:hypothetical protein